MKVAAIFHAGDFIAPFAAQLLKPANLSVPTHLVYGNNDGERAGLKKVLPHIQDGTLRVELGGRTIVMHHFIDWFGPGDMDGADLVISGHTHEVVNEKRGDQLILNPGECCGWVTERCTIATVDLDQLEAQIIEVST
jgi:putative phosphoesterase